MRRILFAATGEIAVPTLRALAQLGLIGAVLTSPDAPGKRGKGLIPSPIKSEALALNLPLFQMEHLKKEARFEIAAMNCDTLVSFCYGKIFGPLFLGLFKGQAYNIHPSLLPKYRGCAPIEAALLNGDKQSGISIQKLALGIDEGELIKVAPFEIEDTDNAVTLCEKVATLAPLLACSVFTEDSLVSVSQKGEASYSALIQKEDGFVDFSNSAKTISNQIRAYYPWPKVVCKYKDTQLFLCAVSSYDEEETSSLPGTVLSFDKQKGFKIATGKGSVYVSRLQLATKKELDATSFRNGNPDFVNSVLVKLVKVE